MTTFLIVDDHVSFRQQARALLESEGLDVIGEAEDAASAIRAVRTLRPDVVVLDIGLPDGDGFEVARRLASEVPRPRVVLTSSREATVYGPRLDASASIGFVRKDDLSGPVLVRLLAGDRGAA